MFFLFPLLATFLLVAAPARADQPNGCPDYALPLITIDKLALPPRLNNALDLISLRQMAMDTQKQFSSQNNETPVGLTAASLKLDSQFEIRVRSTSNDPMVCAQISALTLHFGFDDTTVYMARELPQNSCSYGAVLGHEQHHIAVDQALVDAMVPTLQTLLQQAVASIGVIRASSSKVAEQQIATLIHNYMGELGAHLSDIRKKRQAQVDTPAEYDRLSRSCDGELSQIIRTERRL
ncbi:MAG: hypothetical protein WC612_07530 [Bdellovibrionales bacterium]